jgi:hypothetical protein
MIKLALIKDAARAYPDSQRGCRHRRIDFITRPSKKMNFFVSFVVWASSVRKKLQKGEQSGDNRRVFFG